MNRLFPEFRKYVTDNRILREGDSAIVSVSGGVDSMVLLDLMVRLSKSKRLGLAAAHVNHGLRGRESKRDESLVRDAANAYGIECFVRELRPRTGANVQDAARELRLKFLMKLARQRGSGVVCLGHNLNDQAETVIMHLMRGAGLAGLSGMSPLAVREGIRLARPIIFAPRGEIERYARERSIGYREDSTNAKLLYRRNEIRHRLMPLLRELNPRVEEGLSLMASRLREDEEALEAVAEASLHEASIISHANDVVLERGAYCSLPVAIRKRLIMIAYERLAGSAADLNSDQLARIDGIAMSTKASGEYRLKAPLKFSRRGERLTITRAGPRPGSMRPKAR